MVEPGIQAPPNWRPTPPTRESMTATPVRLFKEEVWNANELIRFWAGRADKPNVALTAAPRHVRNVFQQLPEMRRLNRLLAADVAQYNAFAAVWNDGNGSWTASKPLIRALNARLMDLQP